MAVKTGKASRRTALYRSSDPILGGEPGTGGGGGTGATPPEKPSGGAPASGQPGGGTGTPGSGEATIPLDILPESLRGRPTSEIKFTLDTLVKSVTASNARNKALEEEIRSLKTARPPAREPEEPSKPKKALADRLLEDPEAALDEFFQKRADPYTQRLESMNKRLGMAEVEQVRSSIPDFDEYEDEVLALLDDSQTPRTREALMGAYTMVIGQKTIQQRELDRRKALGGSETPAPDAQLGPEKKYNKTALSEEIRVGLGLSEEDYYDRHSSADSFNVKVPT